MDLDRIFILGLGQIGQSISNTLKDNNFRGEILASNRGKVENYSYIDGYFDIVNEKNNYNNSIVFICTPPNVVGEMIENMLKKTQNSNCIITDVCSVKSGIFLHKNIADNKNFISIHPMDGGNSTEKKYFFKKKILNYVIENKNVERHKMEDFCNFLNNFMNCENEIIDYKIHDKIVSMISHIPNLILSALNYDVNVKNNNMWHAIFKENSNNIAIYLEELVDILIAFKHNKFNENYNLFLQKHNINIQRDLQNPSLKKVLNIDFIGNIDVFVSKLKNDFSVLVS